VTNVTWLVVVGELVVLVGVAELVARWWIRARSGYYLWPPRFRCEVRQQLDVFPQMEPHVRIDVNGAGERAGPVPRGRDVFRVLAVGGSPVECASLDQPTSWPGALERLLQSPENLRHLGATRVHVGNIGRSAIASRHLDLVLERVLPRYPRLSGIVIMVGGNDVQQWLAAGTPATLSHDPPSADDTFAIHPELAFGWAPGRSALNEVAHRLKRIWLRPAKVWNLEWVRNAQRMRAEATEVRPATPDPSPMLRRFDYHFRRVLDHARAHADRVLVARQPWLDKTYTAEEARRLWHGGLGVAWRKEHIDVFYSFEVVNDLMVLLDRRVIAIANELRIPHVDLRQAVPSDFDHYYDYMHFTAAGARVVARVVADALLESEGPTAAGSASRGPTCADRK
jgi:lysophospholipase L1-like esterase